MWAIKRIINGEVQYWGGFGAWKTEISLAQIILSEHKCCWQLIAGESWELLKDEDTEEACFV
jgi:hypothetical protein